MIPSNSTEARKAIAKAADAIENARYNLKGGFISATAKPLLLFLFLLYDRYALYKKYICKNPPGDESKIF